MRKLVVVCMLTVAASAVAQPDPEAARLQRLGMAVQHGIAVGEMDAVTACDPDAFERRRYAEARARALAVLGSLPPPIAARGYQIAAETIGTIMALPDPSRCMQAHRRANIAATWIERGAGR